MSGPTIPMNPTDLPKFRSLLRRMSAEDLLSVMPDVRQRERDVESDLVIREAEQAIDRCPHCGCVKVVKAGQKGGRQRFQCKDCGKRFNAMTGTPLARLRMADKHIPNANCMIDGLSIRDVAYKIGVNPKTAFRWRHRFLVAMEAEQPHMLSGVVEVDETFFLESFKGKRSNMPRPAKTRGTPAKSPGLSKEQIPVIVARDRSTGATMTAKIASRSAKNIGAKLIPVLSKDTLLCSDGAKAYASIGKRIGITVKSIKASKKVNPYHLNNVNSYDSRLKGWMFRFRGVATIYLDNYLGWHRMLDKSGPELAGKTLVAGSLAHR